MTDDVIQFLTSVFSRHGNPESIVTDNGPQFTSANFASFLYSRGRTHNKTSVLRSCIQAATQQSQPGKDTVLNWLQVYPATPHATTSTSPYQLLYGRKMRTKLDILPLLPATSPEDASARHAVSKHQEKMKYYADAKRSARKPSFQPGDNVRIKKPFHVPKAHSRFTTPVTVTKKVGPNSFLLSDGKTWNASRLSHVPSVIGQDSIMNGLSHTPANQTPSHRQPRIKNKPKRHKDYIAP